MEDQESSFASQKKRTLSIIEENDTDDLDTGIGSNTRVKDDEVTVTDKRVRDVKSKATARPSSPIMRPTTKHVSKSIISGGERKITTITTTNSKSKKNAPQFVDTAKAKSLTFSESFRTKVSVSPDSKIGSKILHFSQNARVAPKPDVTSKISPYVVSKSKSSSSLSASSSSLSRSASSPTPTTKYKISPTTFKSGASTPKSQKSSPHFENNSPETKEADDKTNDEEVIQISMKDKVKRTISMLESNKTSTLPPPARCRKISKSDSLKRKTSKEEESSQRGQSSDKLNPSVDLNIVQPADIMTHGESKDSVKEYVERTRLNPSTIVITTTPPSSSPPEPETSSIELQSLSSSDTTSHPKSTDKSKSKSDEHNGIRVQAETSNKNLANLTSTIRAITKITASPPTSRVPFSKRQNPIMGSRPLSDSFSLSKCKSKLKGAMNLTLLSVPLITSKGEATTETSDSENDEIQNPNLNGDKSRITPRSPFLAPKFHPRRGSYFFKRRLSSESLASLSENESADNFEDPTPVSASDFNKLKETADRLRLSTRRASVLQWRQQFVDSPSRPMVTACKGFNGDISDEKLTSERKQKIDEAIDWIQNELQEMHSQDQMLARQLLTIRNDIHQIKLRRCTAEHQELLDDFKSELEELQEFSDVLDLPQPIYEDNPLKHIGVTRLNINARRFSAC